ncbi:MAG: GNAT family N-acetyltransferase [Sphingomonadales bacterium]
MKIIPLNKSYAKAVSSTALISKAYWGYSQEFMEKCREELTFGETFFKTHIVKGVFVGKTLAGFYAFKTQSKKKGELAALFVLPEFIGKGAGRALVGDCLNLARILGVETIAVESDPFAKPFYSHFGWSQVGEVPSDSIPGRSLPLMELRL